MLKLTLAALAISLLLASASARDDKIQQELDTVRQLRERAGAARSSSNNGHCRLQGVVTLGPDSHGPDYDFYFQDSTGGILMRATRLWQVAAGDTVEISGLVRSPYSIAVQNLNRLSEGAKITPRPVRLEEASGGAGFGELITVSGPLRKSADAILVGLGPSLEAYVRNSPGAAALPPNWQAGSKAEVTGVLVSGPAGAEGKQYRLALRGPGDIATVRTFPLITPSYIVSALATIGFFAVLMVRSRNRKRTQQIQSLLVKAEESAKLKSEFLASMSHEIRTPLNGVMGMIDLVLATELTDDQRQNLQFGKQSSESLLVVINDILDFSKIEAGKLQIDQAPFNLRKAFEATLVPLMFRARAKGLTLTCDIAPEAPSYVVGDPLRLGQVVTNLVGNAIKFTQAGEITIRVEQLGSAGKMVDLQITVTDMGIGIPQQKLDRLFQPFTQVDGSLARRFTGTGLGLSIAKQLVELMGGRIWVEKTAEGEGSSFAFTASFEQAAAPDVPMAADLAAEPSTVQYSLRVLLAEDNPINQRLVISLLHRKGCRVTAVENGVQALQAFEGSAFDLILMDLQMPEMDGLATAQLIRKREKPGQRVPITALTAGAMKGDREKCIAAGMDDYITKPFKAEELLAKIDSVGSRLPASRHRSVTQRFATGRTTEQSADSAA